MEPGSNIDTVTILFTDIEGSTSLWVEHPREAGPALAIHDLLLAQAVESNGGTVVKTTGDGVMAVFRSIEAGIGAAVSAQLALEAHVLELLNAARVRMGLHVGAVERRVDDYFGLAVNECQRLMSIGHAGQILISEVAYQLARDNLPPGCTVKDLGLQQLRGIPDPERIFQLVHPELETDFPPLGPGPGRHELPAQLTRFVGRGAELAQILALVPQHRLMTLTGPGGTGKTRLAIEVSQHSEDLFPDGVWMVELANIADSGLVARHTAAALNLEEAPGKGDVEAIKEFLAPRTALLIMDNCEHVAEAAAVLVQELLSVEGGLTILATSRERLRVPGEAVFPVPPLDLPPENAGTDAAGYDSIQLFIDRAALAQPGFALRPGNASALIQIARRLDGIPLAIELAAAQIAVMSPAQIADHLDHRLGLLTGGARTALPRQQTLQAAIDWSYDRLGGDEQSLFARLAVFVDGFDLPAAEHVAGSGLLRPGSLLLNLVEKSLVTREPDHDGRYSLLETMREYAFDRLEDLEETGATRRRHAEYFAGLLERGSGRMFGPMQAPWLDQLSRDYHNVLAAMSWATEVGDGELLLRLAAPTWAYWLLRGPASEGREWLRKALDLNGDPGELRAVALLGAGALAANQGDIEQAEALLREATTTPGAGRATAGAALGRLAGLAHKKGDLVEASSLFREALTFTRPAGDDWTTGHILAGLSLLLEDQGEHDEAQALAAEGVELARKTGNPDLVGDALLSAGEIAINRNDLPLAKRLLQEALEVSQATGLDLVDAWARVYLGKIACREGELRASRAFLDEGLELFEELSYPMGAAWALRHRAQVEQELGEPLAAAGSLAEAMRLAHEYVKPEVPLVLDAMAQLDTRHGDRSRAAVLFAAAGELAQTLGVRVPDPDRVSSEECWSEIQTEFDDAQFDRLVERGRQLTLAEAVEFALSAG